MSNTSASPISTGGAGNNYEHVVQAAYLLYMMAGYGVSCFPGCKINSMKLQGMYAGYHTDDCILFLEHTQTLQQHKLLAQIKMTARITAGDEEFRESIKAAWKDFNDTSGELFNKEHDRIALITSHLNKTEHRDVLTILSWAKLSESAEDFLLKMEKVSSKEKKGKLNVFRELLRRENGGNAVSDKILWQFLKCYEIITFDDRAEQGNLEFLIRHICDTATPSLILSSLQSYVANANPNAATISPEKLIKSLGCQFKPATAKSDNGDVVIVTQTRPLRPSDFFRGRDGKLEEIKRLLTGNAKLMLLNGMGGIGKTEFCRKLFYECINVDCRK